MWPTCERYFAPSCIALGLVTAVGCGSAAPASAQQSSLPAVDNNGQDFTRPENVFQIRNLYQTAPAEWQRAWHTPHCNDRHDHIAGGWRRRLGATVGHRPTW
jgi:hypothetical protein